MKIDFYILEADPARSLRFACQLLEQCYEAEQSAFVAANDHAQAQQFDQLLWTYREDSFMPHNLVNAGQAPIIIGTAESCLTKDVLMNLGQQRLPDYKLFERVIEIVSNDPSARAAARDRYRSYRDAGDDISTHKLKV